MRSLETPFRILVLASSLTILIASSGWAGEITVDLTTDTFGSETSWTLVEVATGDPIGSLPQGGQASSTTVQYDFPRLDPGDYDFTITDSFGDGICCGFGLGDYTVTADGVATPSPSAGAFGSTEMVTVTVTDSVCSQPVTGGCTVNGKISACRGTSRTDVIIGTDGPDVIKGRGGADYLVGLGGDDIVCGGGGGDVLIGGEGADYLDGGGGDDTLEGLQDNDDLRGRGGDDALDGGGGDDDCRDEKGFNSFSRCEQVID